MNNKATAQPSNGLDKHEITPTIKEFISWDIEVYDRMKKYIKKKGSVRKTQDLARLAVSYFLDKEGF
jgi:hypothetical protein